MFAKRKGKHCAPRKPFPLEKGLQKFGAVTALTGSAIAMVGAVSTEHGEQVTDENSRQMSTIPVVNKVNVSDTQEFITSNETDDFDDVFYRAELKSNPAPEPEPEPEPEEEVQPEQLSATSNPQDSSEVSTVGTETVAEPAVQTTWTTPVKSYKLTSRFGYRNAIPAAGTSSGLHNGIDFAAPLGTDIYAASGGTVVHVGFSDFDTHTGGVVVILHETADGQYLSSYNHMKLSDILVNVGDTVEADQLIAYMGTEGMSTGSHLHFTMREVTGSNPLKDWEYLEPEAFFSARGVTF